MPAPKIPVVEKWSSADTWASNPVLFARQVMTGFVQGVYSAQTDQYHWDEDKQKSRVFVGAFAPVKPESFGTYPAIVVSRSGMQFAATGIGALAGGNWRDGSVIREDLLNGMFIIQHISRDEAEAENLAFFTAEMIWSQQEILAHYGFLVSGGLTVEQPGPAGSLVDGESKGLIAVPAVVPYRCMRRTRTLPLGDPILKAIRTRITGQLAQLPPPLNVGSAAPRSLDPADIGKDARRWERPSSQDSSVMPSSTRTAEPKEE